MKFIFPKNYRYNAKILGIIDYVTAIIDLIIGIILFAIIHLIFKKISTQIYIFIILFFPIILFSIFIPRGENFMGYIICIIKFIKNRKVYLYQKENINKR